MAYANIPFEKRIKENIRYYSLKNLYNMDNLQEYLKCLARTLEIELLLTERHGEKAFSVGSFAGVTPDVVGEPGRKLRVLNRTVGHLYTRTEGLPQGKAEMVERLLDSTIAMLSDLGENTYRHLEYAACLDELEAVTADRRVKYGEREDALTGLYNKLYFESRMQVIDRSGVAPVAMINANINDWKFVNDHYGDEESDRLICMAAAFLREEAQPDYMIGRTDGDVFHILIPMPHDGEADAYCKRVEQRCAACEDSKLSPSLAFGCVYKTNVEEKLEDLMSDAEYEMLDHKFEMKNAPGYRERLEKGLHLQD